MRRDRGFSMIQLLIVAGMLSGIFVVSLKMIKNQNQMGKSSSEEFEISYAFDDMRNLLSDATVCRDTLKNVGPEQSALLEGIAVKEAEDGLLYRPFQMSGKKYGQGNLKVKSLGYLVGDQESSIEDGEAFLKVIFEKSKSALGSTLVEKVMKLHIQLDEKGGIGSCFSLAGVNFSEAQDQKNPELKIWHTVPGTQNIYTNVPHVKIGTHKGSKLFGVSLLGGLRFKGEATSCTKEKKGSLRMARGGLDLCTKNGVWRNSWKANRRLVKAAYKLEAEGKNQMQITPKPYSFCAIADSQLYGARCKSKRLSANLWELSLLYDRGAASTCTFHCFN